ncbi:hypothetical protein I551_7998 [Mycobacterium ulcerans str. Harvey]|uniref:Uncharacterized protein n=1 Tax=Mycobacterium ulcerans str. Harvey TaxID=1299332 RepID=A0ABP3A195_MYCUL|nr:hypothetical protein I551_7998 [Mycobacterium ulcerans str. Harvey]
MLPNQVAKKRNWRWITTISIPASKPVPPLAMVPILPSSQDMT